MEKDKQSEIKEETWNENRVSAAETCWNQLTATWNFISSTTLCSTCFRLRASRCVPVPNGPTCPGSSRRSAGVEGEGEFQAAQLLPTAAQDALKPVVAVRQPVGQIHVGQVEVWLRQRVRTLRRHADREHAGMASRMVTKEQGET